MKDLIFLSLDVSYAFAKLKYHKINGAEHFQVISCNLFRRRNGKAEVVFSISSSKPLKSEIFK
jgi:hypothetical protein